MCCVEFSGYNQLYSQQSLCHENVIILFINTHIHTLILLYYTERTASYIVWQFCRNTNTKLLVFFVSCTYNI